MEDSSAWRALSCGSSGATSRWIKGPLWAADGAWPGLEEGEGDGDGQAHKDCLHPPPSPIDPHDSTATEESPVVWLEGGIVYVQLGYSIKV